MSEQANRYRPDRLLRRILTDCLQVWGGESE